MSGHVPSWLADWLGLEVGAGVDGATWQLDSAWSWAPWATLLLVLSAVVWTIAIYRREQTAAGLLFRGLLATLRLAAIGILLMMLAQWALAIRLTGPPPLALVIDRSASMSIVDRYAEPEAATKLTERLRANGFDGATRLDVAKLIATENDGRLLKELARRYRLSVYTVADSVERLPRDFDMAAMVQCVRELKTGGEDSQLTRLGDAVRHVLADSRGNPPAAVILLTDGVTTAGVPLADAVQDARRVGVPLVAVGLGSDQPPRDIELVDVLVDDAVFAGDVVNFQVHIKANGLAGQSVRFVLRRGGDESTESVAEQTVKLPASGEMLTLQVTDRPAVAGDMSYVVEVGPRDDETNRDNNRQQRVVAVRDAKIRVLVAYGYPNYEFRFLKTLLERDPTIELATLLQGADPDYAEQDKTALHSFPVGRDELFGYDVLILGDIDPRQLPRSVWPLVRAFVVEKGGGVAFVAGPQFLPWHFLDNPDVAALMPVNLEGLQEPRDRELPEEIRRGFHVRPTTLGLASPTMQLGDQSAETANIWQKLASLHWLVELEKLKPAAQVFATASIDTNPQSAIRGSTEFTAGSPKSEIPLIVFQYVGAGRVLWHAIDSTWLWRRAAGDAYFARYWVQTIRFLARGKLSGGRGVQLTTDRRKYSAGEAVQVRARFLDARLAPAGDAATVAIESAGGPRRQIALHRNPAAGGVFEGALTDFPQGNYQLLLTEPQVPGNPPVATFAVLAPPGELARLEMDRAALANAAEVSRGAFYTAADADRLLAELPAGRRVPVENLPPVEIWNRWWLLTAFLVCLTGEWILRKRAGML